MSLMILGIKKLIDRSKSDTISNINPILFHQFESYMNTNVNIRK